MAYAWWGATAVFHLPVWNPLDEGDHWSIITDIQDGRPWPDPLVRPKLPAYLPRWDVSNNLEAAQPPLYYYAVAPVKALLEAGGHDRTAAMRGITGLRLLNVAMLVCLLGLLVLAARAVVPGSDWAQVTVPASAFLFRGPVLDVVRIGNDALAGLLATLAFYLALRFRERMTAGRAAMVGATAAAAVGTKYTAVAVLPALALYVLVVTSRPRMEGSQVVQSRRILSVVSGLIGFGAAVAAVLGPVWFWIQHRAGASEGSNLYRVILLPQQRLGPLSWGKVGEAIQGNLDSLVSAQLTIRVRELGLLDRALPWLIGVLTVVGLAAYVGRRARQPGGLAMAALLSAIPVHFVALLLLTIMIDSNALIVGRYDVAVLLPVALLIGLGPLALLPRRHRWTAAWAYVGLAAAIAVNEVSTISSIWPGTLG